MSESAEQIVMGDLITELTNAETKHPGWPGDVIHGAAIVAEECGEMVQAALQATYEEGPMERVYKEAAHTAATALRMMIAIQWDAIGTNKMRMQYPPCLGKGRRPDEG